MNYIRLKTSICESIHKETDCIKDLLEIKEQIIDSDLFFVNILLDKWNIIDRLLTMSIKYMKEEDCDELFDWFFNNVLMKLNKNVLQLVEERFPQYCLDVHK